MFLTHFWILHLNSNQKFVLAFRENLIELEIIYLDIDCRKGTLFLDSSFFPTKRKTYFEDPVSI